MKHKRSITFQLEPLLMNSVLIHKRPLVASLGSSSALTVTEVKGTT